MKKLILPIIAFLVFLSLGKYSYAQDAQTSKDCLEKWHNAQYECGQVHKACVNRCSGPKISQCIGACYDELYKCRDGAKAEYDKCLKEQSSELQTSKEKFKQQTQPDQTKPADEGQKTGQPAQVADTLEIAPRGWIPLFATGWLDYFKNLWTIVSFRPNGNPFVEFINGFSSTDHTLCDPATCSQAMDATKRGTNLTEDEVILRAQQSRTLQNYKIHTKSGNVDIGEFNQSSGLNIKTGPDGKVFSTFESPENDIGGVQVFPNTNINLPPKPFHFPGQNSGSTSGQAPANVEIESGEAEFFIIGSVEKPTIRPTFTVATPNALVLVSGTHFWVLYDKDKSFSTIGVYEGKVEVKTKDGKKTTISPDGDKPGVIAVTSKLSVWKLGLAAVVLVATAIGVVLLFKRRNKKLISKRKQPKKA